MVGEIFRSFFRRIFSDFSSEWRNFFHMEYTFDTIKYDEKSSISINNSKFIALSFRVETSEDVRERLEWVAFHHPKTSHICYSYLLRNGESKKEDAGEPSGTAGAPIFNKIRSYEVVDVLVVVVRYYGGVKLGKSGLIHAYSFITDEVLKESEIMTVQIMEEIKVTASYKNLNKLMRLLNRFKLTTESTESTTKDVTLHIKYPLTIKEKFIPELLRFSEEI